jgi:cytochrome c5
LNRDQKFFDMYTLVIGVLAFVMLGLYVLADKMSDVTQDIYTSTGDEYLASVAERLGPAGEVYLPGDEADASKLQVAAAAQPDPVETVLTGPQVFNEACIACHGSGIGGAPTLADTDNWAPRIEQGMDILRSHAIDGYTGSAGYMPPKGARLDLSDDEIHGAIDYMLSQIPK